LIFVSSEVAPGVRRSPRIPVFDLHPGYTGGATSSPRMPRNRVRDLSSAILPATIRGIALMPTISMFYGILVSMYVLDIEKHHLPHIHVRYNEFKAVFSLPEGDLLEGELPSRQMRLVLAWIELRRDELMADWILASAGQTPYKIEPLR
jgi:hypothetical protein